MSWGWPQWAYAALLLTNLLLGVYLHKKPKNYWVETYSFWPALTTSAIVVWILYEGGFWTP